MTLLVLGSGTGVGKTRVVAALTHVVHHSGRSVQIIKPVQTGVAVGDPSDADIAGDLARICSTARFTLRRFPAAIAPLAAAAAAGSSLDAHKLVEEIRTLPKADVRLIEGAGGLAVPLGPAGWDWVDFAEAIDADGAVLVVPDELGAINQSRLVFHYLSTKSCGKLRAGIFLNEIRTGPVVVRQSTRDALAETGTPLWGELSPDVLVPTLHGPLTQLLGV